MPQPLRIMLTFGSRAGAIKLAPVIKALQANPSDIETKVCVTARNRDALHEVTDLFGIDVDRTVRLQPDLRGPTDLLARSLRAIQRVLRRCRPDLLIIQGGATMTMAAALAAFYEGVPVGHVEAGLRTHDPTSPFPEEMNRRVIARLATLHFAPTSACRNNLLAEGVEPRAVTVTGNTGIDSLQMAVGRMRHDPARTEALAAQAFEEIGIVPDEVPFLLVAGRPRDQFGEELREVCLALRDLARRNPQIKIIHVAQLAETVRAAVDSVLGGLPNLHLIGPQPYERFVWLLERCRFVLTDSGGVQEEAPGLGRPVLVLGRTTARPEAVEAGTARIVGTDPCALVAAAESLLHDQAAYMRMTRTHHPYGDGQASRRIVAAVLAHFDALGRFPMDCASQPGDRIPSVAQRVGTQS